MPTSSNPSATRRSLCRMPIAALGTALVPAIGPAIALSATPASRSPGSTVSTTKACRAGRSKADRVWRATSIAITCHTCTAPVHARAARQNACTIITAWQMRITVRRGALSAIEPPQSARGMTGISPMAEMMPSAAAEPVSR